MRFRKLLSFEIFDGVRTRENVRGGRSVYGNAHGLLRSAPRFSRESRAAIIVNIIIRDTTLAIS